MTSSTIARIASGRNDALLSFADSIVEFTNAGGTIDELRTVIADAQKPAKPARKPRTRTRKPAPAKAKPATTVKADVTFDPNVGTGENMRMTLRGIMMPTDKPASTARIVAIQDKFDRDAIVAAAQSLKFHGKSLHTLNVADASDLLFTLKNA